MKNHRFPWLRNRTTDNRKCEKARNIKEKRTIEMFSTVSKQPDVRLSSQRDNHTEYIFPGSIPFPGIFFYFLPDLTLIFIYDWSSSARFWFKNLKKL